MTKKLCASHVQLETLKSKHEEADTRLLLHTKYATHPRSQIIIQSPDTLTRSPVKSCSSGLELKIIYIPVYAVSEKLGQKLCKSLPAFHALTGCNTASSLTRLALVALPL